MQAVREETKLSQSMSVTCNELLLGMPQHPILECLLLHLDSTIDSSFVILSSLEDSKWWAK